MRGPAACQAGGLSGRWLAQLSALQAAAGACRDGCSLLATLTPPAACGCRRGGGGPSSPGEAAALQGGAQAALQHAGAAGAVSGGAAAARRRGCRTQGWRTARAAACGSGPARCWRAGGVCRLIRPTSHPARRTLRSTHPRARELLEESDEGEDPAAAERQQPDDCSPGRWEQQRQQAAAGGSGGGLAANGDVSEGHLDADVESEQERGSAAARRGAAAGGLAAAPAGTDAMGD